MQTHPFSTYWKWSISLLQDTLQFWDLQKGVKGEQRQVFLFDHQILIALPVNTEGFYDFQTGIKVFLYFSACQAVVCLRVPSTTYSAHYSLTPCADFHRHYMEGWWKVWRVSPCNLVSRIPIMVTTDSKWAVRMPSLCGSQTFSPSFHRRSAWWRVRKLCVCTQGEILSTTLFLQPLLPLHSHTPIHMHTHINTKLWCLGRNYLQKPQWGCIH